MQMIIFGKALTILVIHCTKHEIGMGLEDGS